MTLFIFRTTTPTTLEFSCERIDLRLQHSIVSLRRTRSRSRRSRRSLWRAYLLLLTQIPMLCHGVKCCQRKSKRIFLHIQQMPKQRTATGNLWTEHVSSSLSSPPFMIVATVEWFALSERRRLAGLRRSGVECGTPSTATTLDSGQSQLWRGWKWSERTGISSTALASSSVHLGYHI